MTTPKILITGANTGIGFTTAQHLVKTGAHVILACRNSDKAAAAQQKLQQLNAGQVDVVSLDLNSLSNVHAAADLIANRYASLDVLINNAGLFSSTRQHTQDGFEQMFGVNYLGHFLLTQRLLPVLQQATKARIVNLASIAHWVGSIKPDTFYAQGFYNPLFFYGQSKLANLLFSHSLAKKLEGSSVTSNALHPGAVDSDIYRELPKAAHKLLQIGLVPTSQPAQLIEEMALSQAWEGKNGQYASVQTPSWQSHHAKNSLLADQLYDHSMELVKAYL